MTTVAHEGPLDSLLRAQAVLKNTYGSHACCSLLSVRVELSIAPMLNFFGWPCQSASDKRGPIHQDLNLDLTCHVCDKSESHVWGY